MKILIKFKTGKRTGKTIKKMYRDQIKYLKKIEINIIGICQLVA
jgi:hypothetical protein